MSAKNGEEVIRLGTKGRRTYALGDEGKPFTVDIIEINTQWSEIDREYRDAGGKVSPENLAKLNYAAWDFVKKVANDDTIPFALALEFMKSVAEQAEKLKDFFEFKSAKKEPSSPEPSTTMRFST